MDELKSRLEILLGAVPEGYLDESQKNAKLQEATRLQRREKVADAGGQMLTAAFSFLTQMLPDSGTAPSTETVDSIRSQLSDCAETADQGRKSLRINLPDEESPQQFAQSLAKLMSFAK